MKLESAKKILKIFGVLSVISGIFTILTGILSFAGGGMLATDESTAEMGVTALALGLILLISGIITILQGIFSISASKNSAKIMPAWIIAIISLISNIISLISSIKNGTSAVSGIVSLLIAVLIFVAANTIKANRNKEAVELAHTAPQQTAAPQDTNPQV